MCSSGVSMNMWVCWGGKLYRVSVSCVCVCVCSLVYISNANLHCVIVYMYPSCILQLNSFSLATMGIGRCIIKYFEIVRPYVR